MEWGTRVMPLTEHLHMLDAWLLSSHLFMTTLGLDVIIHITLRKWGLRMGTNMPKVGQR